MITVTLTRTESFDPISVIEQATAQAAAERTTRELLKPGNERALSYHFRKDSNSQGDYVDLVIEGEDHNAVNLLLARLQACGCTPQVEYPPEEEPPDLIEITDTDDGCPADEARAREVMDYYGYAGPLEPGSQPGLYRVILPANSLTPDVATLDDGDWSVEVLQRRRGIEQTRREGAALAETEPYAGEIENVLMDRGWLVREHPREVFAAEADAPPEDGALSLVAYHDGRIVYFDWSTTHSSHGHTNDPLLPHQFAESVELRHSR